MSDNASADKQVKKPAKFDLSDGISSEDFIALGHGLVNAFVFVLKIIFFPIIWVKRMLVKLQKFLFDPHAERLLTEDEKLLVSSVPIFLGFLGLTLGAIFAIIAYINNGSDFLASFKSVSDFFKLIGGWIKGTFDVIGIIWGFIYQDILIGTKNLIINSIFGANVDKLIPFFALSMVGFFGAIIILSILELQFVRTILGKISDLIVYIISLPFDVYNWFQTTWNKIIALLGYPVMGGKEMLNKYSNKFYQKALRLILLFAIIFLFLAFYIFITTPALNLNDTTTYLYLIFVMLFAGLFAGYPVAFVLVKAQKSLSKDKYEARTVVPTPSSVVGASAAKTTGTTAEKATKPVPVANLKGKTAKERAEERRKLHEMQKK